jgi:stage V sporulation protein B
MKQQSTAKGFAVLSAAGMMVKIISLLYVPFLTQIIGPEGYGIYVAAYQIFIFAYVLTNSGVPVAISKLVSELVAQDNYKDAIKAFKIARALLLVMGLAISVLLLVVTKPLVTVTGNPRTYLAVVALSPTIFITSVMSAYRGYFQGMGNMTPTAISQIGEQIINTIFSLVFAAMLIGKSLELGVLGGTIGTTLGALIACIYLIVTYERYRKFRIPKDKIHLKVKRLSNKALVRKLIHYSIPITLSVGLQNAGTIVDLGNIKNRLAAAGFDEAAGNIKYGLLGQFNTLIHVPITLISALSAAALPGISGASAVGDRRTVQEKINYVFKVCCIVAIPSAVGLAVLSKPIYHLLFPRSSEGYYLLSYGSIVVILMAVVQIQTTILQSLGRLYTAMLSMLMGIVAKIFINYILVGRPEINILGAIFGNIVCFIIPLVVNLYTLRKTLKVKIKLVGHMLSPAISSLLMGTAVYIVYFVLDNVFMNMRASYFFNAISIFLEVLIGFIVYVYSLVVTGAVSQRDIDSLSPRLTKLIPDFIKRKIK